VKTIYSNEEAESLVHNGVLAIEDDLEIAFNGFEIEADIQCYNIYSKDKRRSINAWDINAWDINALDINALDINAWDINARDISYYAVCFAYHDIKCKNINGCIENAKHFCLDGEITTKEED
jgi:hypothetical protein